ncbi:hypothetical protein DDJ68_13060 [Mycobacteroides abscessus]|nr:hypothetical protein DDJ68_13060 [Mycobacteroides abscessus]
MSATRVNSPSVALVSASAPSNISACPRRKPSDSTVGNPCAAALAPTATARCIRITESPVVATVDDMSVLLLLLDDISSIGRGQPLCSQRLGSPSGHHAGLLDQLGGALVERFLGSH